MLSFFNKKKKKESSIGPWLVFEYMALGDLAQLLRASNGNHPCGKSGKLTYALNQVCHFFLFFLNLNL